MSTYATLTTTRRFYQLHRGWLAAQLALFLVALTIGVAGFFVAVWLAVAGLAITVVFGLVGLFVVPAWRDRIEERQWS